MYVKWLYFEWMDEMDTYIPPNIRLISQPYLGKAEPGTNAMINCLFSHHHIFRHFLVFNHLSICIFPYPLLFLAIYALHAGYLFVTDTLSTPTITESPSVECQDLLIPTRSNACVARIDLGLKSHPNDWAMRYKSLA